MEQERIEYHVKSYRTDCNCQRLRGRFSTPEEAAHTLEKLGARFETIDM